VLFGSATGLAAVAGTGFIPAAGLAGGEKAHCAFGYTMA
jgi:hypothetical protein